MPKNTLPSDHNYVSPESQLDILPDINKPLPRSQAMYVCIRGTERRFFPVMSTPSNATAHFRDPPPTP